MVFPKVGKHLSNMVVVFGNIFEEDKDVIQIYNHKNIGHVLEDVVHEVLEGGR